MALATALRWTHHIQNQVFKSSGTVMLGRRATARCVDETTKLDHDCLVDGLYHIRGNRLQVRWSEPQSVLQRLCHFIIAINEYRWLKTKAYLAFRFRRSRNARRASLSTPTESRSEIWGRQRGFQLKLEHFEVMIVLLAGAGEFGVVFLDFNRDNCKINERLCLYW